MGLKILMVCLGNICRSPMAHGILQHKIGLKNFDWEVDSAGTSNYHEGELPDRRAIACMKRHGIDITYQRSRPFLYEDLYYYDHIFVMDNENYENVSRVARNETDKEKIALVMSLVDAHHPQQVPDPYYGPGDAGFELVYGMLDKATDELIKKYGNK